jgi:hypothetical protein
MTMTWRCIESGVIAPPFLMLALDEWEWAADPGNGEEKNLLPMLGI